MTQHRETRVITAGRPAHEPGTPLNREITLASSLYEEGYAREGQPTWASLEEAVGALDGGRAVSFSSGMAACSAVISGVEPGGTVVADRTMYMGVRVLLDRAEKQGRVRMRWVDMTDTAAACEAIEGAALVWVETPQNPLISIADLPALIACANDAGVPVAVDSTMATPLALRPLELGATWAVHSATKYFGGHADLLAGIVVASGDAEYEAAHEHRSLHGATPGALEAFLALRGIRTLAVRRERCEANAVELARRLDDHDEVERVRHPSLPNDSGHERMRAFMDGPGGVLAFEPSGGPERADALCHAAELIIHATSFGGVESSMERRARYPDEAEIPPSLIRLSVGCEHVEDLWADLEAALAKTAG